LETTKQLTRLEEKNECHVFMSLTQLLSRFFSALFLNWMGNKKNINKPKNKIRFSVCSKRKKKQQTVETTKKKQH
jgi:hypothetical protein